MLNQNLKIGQRKKPKQKKPKQKKPVFETLRRVAIWRSLIINQTKQLHYVSLSGDCISKPRCFAAAKLDKTYLGLFGIQESGLLSSLSNCFHAMSPYSDNWVEDPTNLHHWYIPSSIIEAYRLQGVSVLYQWQSEVLQCCLHTEVQNRSIRRDDRSIDTIPLTTNVNPKTFNIQQRLNGSYDDGNRLEEEFGFCVSQRDIQVLGPLVDQIKYQEQRQRILYHGMNECGNILPVKSVIFSAPTSGGKSLVAEIIMARAALFCGRRSLLILPHVALCEEKVTQLRQTLGAAGLRIEAFHSNEGSAATWHPGIDIAVCTIEKANAILNRVLNELNEEMAIDVPNCKTVAGLETIGVVVVDELHLVGDPQRGFLLELLLTKLRRLKTVLKNYHSITGIVSNIKISIVGLSATLPNLDQIGLWMCAEVAETSNRPLPLDLFFKSDRKIMRVSSSGTPLFVRDLPSNQLRVLNPITMERTSYKDNDHVGFLVWECLRMRQQTLVFCATKDWCQKACHSLTKLMAIYRSGNASFADDENDECIGGISRTLVTPILSDHGPKYCRSDLDSRLEVIEALKQAAPNRSSTCSILMESILEGVAYHHAGMSVEERGIIEDAYRKGFILSLCATSTLAVGVNLPVFRVIFRSTQIGHEFLDATRFRQMAGRAGRTGFDLKGEAYVLCSNLNETAKALKLIASPVPPVQSVLNKMRLTRLILELVSLGLCTTVKDVHETIMEETLIAQQLQLKDEAEKEEMKNEIEKDIKRGFQYLISNTILHIPNPSRTESIDESRSSSLRHFQDSTNTFPHPLWSPVVLVQFFNVVDVDYRRSLSRHHPLSFNAFNSLSKESSMRMELITEKADTNKTDETLDDKSDSLSYFGLNSRLVATPLGRGIVDASMSIPEGLEVFADIYRTYVQGLLLKSDLHLLVLISPMTQCIEPDWNLYFHLFNRLDNRQISVAKFFGINLLFIRQALQQRSDHLLDCLVIHDRWYNDKITASNFIRFHQLQNHRRFFSALILLDILSGTLLHRVAERFNLRFGVIQTLRARSMLTAGVISVLCDRLGWRELGNVFRRLSEKLDTAQSGPINVQLREIDLLQGQRAVALAGEGFTTIESIASASVDSIAHETKDQTTVVLSWDMPLFWDTVLLREFGACEICDQALEVLTRSEVPVGLESKDFFNRQTRRRRHTATQIIFKAKEIMNKRLQSLEDEAELSRTSQ